jgi:hypothetical protein
MVCLLADDPSREPAAVQFISKKKRVCIISEPAGYLHIFLWLDMVITSSESGQRLLVTIWLYCVSGFEEEHINASYTDGQQSQDRTK